MKFAGASPAGSQSAHPPWSGGLGAVFVTIFVDLVGFSIIFPLFPAMLTFYVNLHGPHSLLGRLVGMLGDLATVAGVDREFGTIVLFGGILGSLYSLLQFLSAPLWGRISDLHGRRPILLITVLVTALSYLVWVFAGSIWILVLSRILSGLAGGNISVATAAVADLTTEERRARGMALVGVAFGLGFMVGPAMGGISSLWDLSDIAVGKGSWRLNPFSLSAACAFFLSAFNLFWIWTRFPETRRGDADNRSEAKEAKDSRPPGTGVSLPAIRRAVLVYFLFMLPFSGMEFTLTFLAAERLAYGPTENVRIFLFIGIVLLFVHGWFVRRYAERLGERALARSGIMIGIVAFAVLSTAATALPFYLGLLLMAIGVGMVSPSLSAMVSRYADAATQGKFLGKFRAAGSLGRAFGPIVAATFYWLWGSAMAYRCGSLVLAACLLIALALPRPERPREGLL